MARVADLADLPRGGLRSNAIAAGFAAAPNGDIVVADMSSGNLRRHTH